MPADAAHPPPDLVAARVRDPYPYLAWLRRHAPAYVERRPGRPVVWQVSRYEDVRALLTDARLSKDPDRVPGYVPGPAGFNRHLVHADPPDHTRLRTLVNTAFVPRRTAILEPFIREVAHRLLDRVEHHTHVDLIADFAAPLTFRMICAILGVPEHLDTPETRDTLMATIAPEVSADPARTERELHRLLDALIAQKRSGEGPGTMDLLGALLRAGDESGTISEEELRSTAYLLLLVGHDTSIPFFGGNPRLQAGRESDLRTALTPRLERAFLLFDVLLDDRQRRATAGPGEVGTRPEPAVHDEAVDAAGELLPQVAGGHALERVHQGRQGDLRRVVHQKVHVILFTVELDQVRAEVGTDVPHDLFAARQHVVVEDFTPVLCDEHQMRVQVVDDVTAPANISIWFPAW